ncbi:hypothetical protein [Polaribacter ponticola]|jgi:hypothetical protein|uniref:Uncharacterized protein n=1 Tax=Polaribacter ponticola TaxID=2978475 RepID=A0ABT5S4Z4_9FLAO|nr:hypothetical protein [Polaribacter sp. MSW5]MDD7913177.1 hypothetical protein [Polaribacter sp. MSW5]
MHILLVLISYILLTAYTAKKHYLFYAKASEAYGSITPYEKYFFFHRTYGVDTGDIYWVDAQFIENLRPN